jgi:hypothetical protein
VEVPQGWPTAAKKTAARIELAEIELGVSRNRQAAASPGSTGDASVWEGQLEDKQNGKHKQNSKLSNWKKGDRLWGLWPGRKGPEELFLKLESD